MCNLSATRIETTVQDVPALLKSPQPPKLLDVLREHVLRLAPEAADPPDPALTAALAALNGHYAPQLGEPPRTAGMCLYRDGRDSVAWHGDTIGRGAAEDTIVAIASRRSATARRLSPPIQAATAARSSSSTWSQPATASGESTFDHSSRARSS